MFVRKVNRVEDLKDSFHSGGWSYDFVANRLILFHPSMSWTRERHDDHSHDIPVGLLSCCELWVHTADVFSATTWSYARSAEINLHTFGTEGKPRAVISSGNAPLLYRQALMKFSDNRTWCFEISKHSPQSNPILWHIIHLISERTILESCFNPCLSIPNGRFRYKNCSSCFETNRFVLMLN
jgi:hypothetical protein